MASSKWEQNVLYKPCAYISVKHWCSLWNGSGFILLFSFQVYELASVKDNRTRADVLKHWHKTGGVMIMGYTMYRNLVFSRFVKNKRQKESFAQTLVDPGKHLFYVILL